MAVDINKKKFSSFFLSFVLSLNTLSGTSIVLSKFPISLFNLSKLLGLQCRKELRVTETVFVQPSSALYHMRHI